MKKKTLIILLLAFTVLLGTVGVFAAGDEDDPLISLSFIENRFIPNMVNTFRIMFEDMDKGESSVSSGASETGTKTVLVSAGGSVELSSGQTLVLTSGKASFSPVYGSIVNASMGAQAGAGNVNKYQRYIICEDSLVYVDISEDAQLTVSEGAYVTQGDGRVSPFKDVQRSDWFFDDVLSAYERGLVNGMSATTFEPDGTLTAAQCVKLAACMHQLYREGEVSLENSPAGEPWYRSYVDYAIENGILLQEYHDYNAIIVRQQFVQVFYRALPEWEYAEMNYIEDGDIPDVGMFDPGSAETYAFYRAGILTGYEDGSFGSSSYISRCEVATIMNRMFDASARKEISFD